MSSKYKHEGFNLSMRPFQYANQCGHECACQCGYQCQCKSVHQSECEVSLCKRVSMCMCHCECSFK